MFLATELEAFVAKISQQEEILRIADIFVSASVLRPRFILERMKVSKGAT